MDHLYYRNRRSPRRTRKKERFVPFMVLVSLFVLCVLLIQLLMGMKTDQVESQKTKVHLFTDRGSVEYLPWGTNTYTDAHNNAVLYEGDKVKTDAESYAVLEFFDGSRVRLNQNTEVSLDRVDSDKKGIYADIRVLSGEVWINELETEHYLEARVKTDHLNVTPVGTVFSVSNLEEEFVRVVRGEVRVLVADTSLEDAELLDAVNVGVGQQVSLAESDIEALEARKFVSLLESVDDYWRVTEWYIWNMSEDNDPTAYVNSATDSNDDTEADEIADTLGDVDLPTVNVTNPPSTPFDITEPQIFLKGEVSKDVTKVVVTEFYKDSNGTPYELSKYVPGSGIWNYSASVDAGNLLEGRNRFVITAFNDDGLTSDPVEVIVNVVSESDEDEDVADDTSEEPKTSDQPDTEQVEPEVEPETVDEPETTIEVTGALNTPAIGSIENATLTGTNTYTTTAERVVINGIASSGTQEVIVNNFSLSLYEPGSSSWTYYAKTEIGTLKTGSNTYTVIAKDANGNSSSPLTFTIIKE